MSILIVRLKEGVSPWTPSAQLSSVISFQTPKIEYQSYLNVLNSSLLNSVSASSGIFTHSVPCRQTGLLPCISKRRAYGGSEGGGSRT